MASSWRHPLTRKPVGRAGWGKDRSGGPSATSGLEAGGRSASPVRKAAPWLVLLAAALVVGAVASAVVGSASSKERYSPIEARVKAAYLLNFTRYVEWPVDSFAEPASPVVIAVLGRDPLGSVLDDTIKDRTSNGRAVVARRIKNVDDAVSCHLVFISSSEEEHLAAHLRQLSSLPILTVGESERFFELGGSIKLVIVDESVRFQVNLRATQEAGLRISSRMLALAMDVVFPEESADE